ncbi:hypothetical protein VNO77_32561 [Canavalia gladiata]|uniref:Coenzyme Q-binding protein COQ10 START domain-containing protein n=1 Tax=Canavalia gladiata TaxID=3824 RepID=A0AAN9Q4G8_CANGL
MSTTKALRSFASRKRDLSQLINSTKSSNACRSPSSSPFARALCNNIHNAVQSRQFIRCGDGEQGVLSKIYEEKRVLGYSQEQLFDVVAAVDLYHGFVPWCQRSEILKHHPDGSFDAELEIGFKFLVESYVSHVELNRPKLIKTTVSRSNLFDHLINVWEFSPGPIPGTCNLHFMVDFKFQSPLYRQQLERSLDVFLNGQNSQKSKADQICGVFDVNAALGACQSEHAKANGNNNKVTDECKPPLTNANMTEKEFVTNSLTCCLSVEHNCMLSSVESQNSIHHFGTVNIFSFALMFFTEVASRMVSSFHERCRLIHGAEVPVLENSYGEKA